MPKIKVFGARISWDAPKDPAAEQEEPFHPQPFVHPPGLPPVRFPGYWNQGDYSEVPSDHLNSHVKSA